MSASILVTGPSRSGKSEFAERWAARLADGGAVVYLATAQRDPDDAEWRARLDRHRDRRPDRWRTIEAPRGLVEAIGAANAEAVPPCLLVDAFGTWVANWLGESDADWAAERDRLVAAIAAYRGSIVCVAEETGWGVVPAYPAGRQFRDRLGELTRAAGEIVDRLYLVVAGYAIDVKAVGIAIDAPFKAIAPAAERAFEVDRQTGENIGD